MGPADIIQPLTLEQIQSIRRLAAHPDFRPKAVELVDLIRTNRDQVQQYVDNRRQELLTFERALEVASRNLGEAEKLLREIAL